MESSTAVSLSCTVQLQSDMKMGRWIHFFSGKLWKKGKQIPSYTIVSQHKLHHTNGKKPHKAEKPFFLDILSDSLTTDLISHSKKCGEVKQWVDSWLDHVNCNTFCLRTGKKWPGFLGSNTKAIKSQNQTRSWKIVLANYRPAIRFITSEFQRKNNKYILLSFHLCSETHPSFSPRFKISPEGHLEFSGMQQANSEMCFRGSPWTQFNYQVWHGFILFSYLSFEIFPPCFFILFSFLIPQTGTLCKAGREFFRKKVKKGKLKKTVYQPICFDIEMWFNIKDSVLYAD